MPYRTLASFAATPARKMTVGIIGLGQIGSALAKRMMVAQADENFPVRLVAVCSLHEKPDLALEGVGFTNDYRAITEAENIDIVVEAVGGASIAYDIVAESMDNTKHVVSPNRALLAVHGKMLYQIAESKKVQLRVDAAALGVMPSLHLLRLGLAGTTITRVAGVLNAESNHVLLRMEINGETLEQAQKAVKELGLGGSDLAHDLAGKDTLMRLALIRSATFGVWTDLKRILPTGLENITPTDVRLAKKLGYRIKLLGVADPNTITVSPHLVPAEGVLGSLAGKMIGIVISTAESGPIILAGDGGGVESTVSGLMTDLIAIAKQRVPLYFFNSAEGTAVPPVNSLENFYFVRGPVGVKHFVTTDPNMRLVEEIADGNLVGLKIASRLSRSGVVDRLRSADSMVLDMLDENTN